MMSYPFLPLTPLHSYSKHSLMVLYRPQLALFRVFNPLPVCAHIRGVVASLSTNWFKICQYSAKIAYLKQGRDWRSALDDFFGAYKTTGFNFVVDEELDVVGYFFFQGNEGFGCSFVLEDSKKFWFFFFLSYFFRLLSEN